MKGVLPILGWVLVGLALLASFFLDFANTAQGGAIDLRNRVTGLRLMEHGIDAYHYKWSRTEPEEYCDPFNNPLLTVSRTTATPALVMLNVPLAPLPYRVAQLLWLLVQWVLLLVMAWWWLRACGTGRQASLVALLITGFTYTAAWRLHTERGQSYVVLAFFLAWWLLLTRDAKRGNGFVAGLIAGILIALRPPSALLIPFLALHRRGQLLGLGAGLLLSAGLPMLWVPGCWGDYFAAMQVNAELNRTHYYPHFSQDYPPRIEGVPTDILAHYASLPFAEYSFSALVGALGLPPLPDVVPPVLAVLFFAAWLWRLRAQTMERMLPGLAAIFFLVDLFLPAYRNSYNDVFILNLVCLLLATEAKIPWAVWPCVLALPVGWAVYVYAPTEAWIIDFPSALYTLGAVAAAALPVHPLTFLFNKGARSRKVAAAC